MAQLAEQLICNQQVIGSSPIIGFVLRNQYNIVQLNMRYFGWIPEWPKGTDCKSAANCFGGSNPPPSISRKALADVAQLAEQLICNQQVIGSSPIIGLISIEIINFISRDGAVWKLVGLITRRSQVQILLPQFCPDSSVGRAED